MTIHNEAKEGEIAKVVLMPGDPLRAKYIAETFLEDYKLVNSVRNIYAYTGKYKGKEITVMASGMGMPSMGIYCYELYKFYGVETIIRIGSCGAYKPDLDILDVVLIEKSFTESNFAKAMTGEECHAVNASKEVNDLIENTAKENNLKCIRANIACTEYFDPYLDNPQAVIERIPEEENVLGSEMEAFALFLTAKQLNKKAACLVTVADSNYKQASITVEQRQEALNDMIKLALESSIKL
jgi:purine-nucleoside phosphorylase